MIIVNLVEAVAGLWEEGGRRCGLQLAVAMLLVAQLALTATLHVSQQAPSTRGRDSPVPT